MIVVLHSHINAILTHHRIHRLIFFTCPFARGIPIVTLISLIFFSSHYFLNPSEVKHEPLSEIISREFPNIGPSPSVAHNINIEYIPSILQNISFECPTKTKLPSLRNKINNDLAIIAYSQMLICLKLLDSGII